MKRSPFFFLFLIILLIAPMTLTGCSADDLAGPDTELPEGPNPSHGRNSSRNF